MISKEIFIEEKLTMYLFLLKIFPNVKGYHLIKEAVKEIIDDPTLKFNVCQRLYSVLANKLGEDEDLIDRAIRHAIDLSYFNDGITYFEIHTQRHFNVDKPSPRQLFSEVSALMQESLEKFSFEENFNSTQTEDMQEIEL